MPFRLSNTRPDSPSRCDLHSLSGLSNGIFSTSLFRSEFQYHSSSRRSARSWPSSGCWRRSFHLVYTPEQATEQYDIYAAANQELSCWCHAGVVASPAGILRERRNCLLAKPAKVDRSPRLKERRPAPE